MLPPKNTIAYCSQFFPISYVLLQVLNPPSSLKIEGRGSKRNSKSGSEGDKRKEVEGRMARLGGLLQISAVAVQGRRSLLRSDPSYSDKVLEKVHRRS
nr:hypothetical protein Iba_chr06cCG13140 [Ipomoea batatas]